ncbi:MAG: hypothetical protein L3J29_10090 [Cyclobacteriaceae bacterium]|nr:hypothetical protein [Cyclobacteriaceae bacterium]
MNRLTYIIIASTFLISSNLFAQITPSPDRAEGEGPFTQLIILLLMEQVLLTGPVDVVVKGNRITEIKARPVCPSTLINDQKLTLVIK